MAPVVTDLVVPSGRYRLRLMTSEGRFSARLPAGETVVAWQRPDGRVAIRAESEGGLTRARFMLALADDTSEFERRFEHDPLLGPTLRALAGYRPLRVATVAHALLQAVAGQLVDWRRARAIERSILATCDHGVATQEALARLAPAELRRHGLAAQRAATLVRLARGPDLERLREHPTGAVHDRLCRERGLGPWSVGVIALRGLGRYDHGLVGDLGLVKLGSALSGRWIEPAETAALLAPYGDWQGLASELLLRGAQLGLVPGAGADRVRLVRVRARRAA